MEAGRIALFPHASQSSSRIAIECCEPFSGTPPDGVREWIDHEQQGRLVRPCFNEYDDECRYLSSIILRVWLSFPVSSR